MVGLHIGDEVSFSIIINNKGEPQARNVIKREDELLMQADATHGGLVCAPTAAAQNLNLMDEEQARQFQAALRRQ